MSAERDRLAENSNDPHRPWYRWGPYLPERQWGTVREDYSADGSAWTYFSHDQARSRAYRWAEDGIGGFSDRHGAINFSVAVWNGADPILKERLFGLTNSEGNHGEDVKEVYLYEDALPSHAYQRMIYRYPHAAFPYQQLIDENKNRGKDQGEFEILETGVFDENRFFDVIVEYAKETSEDVFARYTIINRGPDAARFWLIPQVTLRNIWRTDAVTVHQSISQFETGKLAVQSERYGQQILMHQGGQALFTHNETNAERIFGSPNQTPFVKDSFHRYVIEKETGAVNVACTGTKVGFLLSGTLEPGESRSISLSLSATGVLPTNDLFELRRRESDDFYGEVCLGTTPDERQIQRLAFAGLIWNKQYYHLDQDLWLAGDNGHPSPPEGHATRNSSWRHFHSGEVISMPDKWEYPWFAAWDLAFHTVAIALFDPRFAKDQLLLLLREWFMHPNGQIPAYEWNFSDVNPPVHAWAALRVFAIERKRTGVGDYIFLEQVFQKLLLNFTWWVNRKDSEGNNLFEGGFLGLDNIGVFDRNSPLPDGMKLEQSDGTSWMAMYCLNLLAIATELSKVNPVYEDIASKFFEHFVYIADAIDSGGIWNDDDEFFYDVIQSKDGSRAPIKVRSLVGLIPLLAITVLEAEDLERMHGFRSRMAWFQKHRPHLVEKFCILQGVGVNGRQVISLVGPNRLQKILRYMLSEDEFLSPFGIRALTKKLRENPYRTTIGGVDYSISYESAESKTGIFGGNSNWRGPIWMPMNFLLVEALQLHGYFHGQEFKVEMPSGSGNQTLLWDISLQLSRRLVSLFEPDSEGKRPVHTDLRFASDPLWQDWIWFYEYFDGETGRGVGASHQTGWTALVAKLIDQLARHS